MSNVLIVAKKEFRDLLNSRMVLVIFMGYIFIMSFEIFTTYNFFSDNGASNIFENNVGIYVANSLLYTLIEFGPILGVLIGCMSIASERRGSALNTLLAKPLYRDTVVNGKLLGSLAFLALVILVSMLFFTSGVLMFCGGLLAPSIGDYLSRIPIVFILSMIMISIFLTASMLISILIKSQAFALMIGTIVVYITYISTYSNVTNISRLFPASEYYIRELITNWSPRGFCDFVAANTSNPSFSPIDSMQVIIPYTFRFLLYIFVLCILCYIAFIKRDVA